MKDFTKAIQDINISEMEANINKIKSAFNISKSVKNGDYVRTREMDGPKVNLSKKFSASNNLYKNVTKINPSKDMFSRLHIIQHEGDPRMKKS